MNMCSGFAHVTQDTMFFHGLLDGKGNRAGCSSMVQDMTIVETEAWYVKAYNTAE